MAVTFPSSPVNGQTFSANGQQYTYNAESSLWDIAATPATSTTAGGITMSDSAPSNPAVGDQWFNTDLLETYIWYSDVHGSYWVKSNPTGATERVEVPTDVNDLTDTSGVIPSDISDLTFNNTFVIQGVREKAIPTLAPPTNIISYDLSAGHIFSHTAVGNWSGQLQNFSMNANESMAVTFVNSNGATAYMISTLSFASTVHSILWASGSAPSGTANGTDVITLSILYDGTTYTVLGQSTGYS